MEALLQEWNGKFGAGVRPPEWVFDLDVSEQLRQQNVERQIIESEERVGKLKKELDRELSLLAWLSKVRENDLSKEDVSSVQGQNHVQTQGDEIADEVFEEKEDFETVPRKPTTADKSVQCSAVTPGRATLPNFITSEDSPSSSEYHTAEQGSSSETSQTCLPSGPIRERSVHKLSHTDSLVAECVSQQVHKSCQDLRDSETPVLRRSRRRYSSVPSLYSERSPSPSPEDSNSDTVKRRILSSTSGEILTPWPASNSNGGFGGGEEHLKQSDQNNVSGGSEKVVLRGKIGRRPSFPMSGEDLNQWKGTGVSTSPLDKRSSNGLLDSYEGYNFMVNTDDDNDPALINVMASRMRGSLRTPRTSVSTDQPTSDVEIPEASRWDGMGATTSPVDNPCHTPVPSIEAAEGIIRESAKHIAPLRKRSSTHDSSPIKRERFSYHYSDDECLTPRIDSGENSAFSETSPSGSNRCSHRNSNGIIDEESPYHDITLRKGVESAGGKSNRKNTENVSPGVASGNGHKETVPALGGDEIFERSDSFTTLGSLDLDIELTLSKLRNQPEMSMATLLDVDENKKLNSRFKDITPDDLEYEEAIEIDEATISAFTLSNDMYGSRSNSATSIPGLFLDHSGVSTSPPEENSPSHSALQGVNLRQSSEGKRLNRKRRGNIDLEMMTGGVGSDNEELSRSSASLTSEEESVPTSPVDENLLSPGSRASRLYPVRHSTVVVHGEQLVIRKLVVVGVVSAEKSYIECLSVMKEYYRKPLLALATSSQPIIGERDISTIFHRVEELHIIHSTLHEQLESVLTDWSVRSCVGEFFVQLCRNLKLYKEYVEMYQKAIECLNRNKAENPLFKKFLDDVHMTVTHTSKDIPKVNELLRRPVERLQSYSLVLNDLCQHTPIEHVDYSILRDSLQTMSAFITSTHDPQAFRELSGGYNREMVKEGLVVELSEGFRKVRRLFLFHDVLVSAKQKPARTSMKFEPKWYLPLKEIKFKCPDNCVKNPVPVTSEMELNVMKNKIAELRAQVNQHGNRDRTRSSSTSGGEGFNIRRNIFMIKYGSNKQSEKIKKKLQEQQVSFWVASPSLPLRIYGNNGKQFMLLLHNEEERENWVSAIKKLIPKALCSVALTSFELQDLVSRQTVNDLRKVEEMIVPTSDDEYLSGVLRVRVMAATELKAKSAGLYCCLELDEYGKFERKARTLPTNTDPVTLVTTWDQDFELELVGSHTLKIQVCSKSLLKEETYAQGKIRLPIKELKQNKRQRLTISLTPQGVITLVIEYFANVASLSRKPTLLASSGVFGVPIEVVAKRERHDIPLIVQTCVDEVEKRGLEEVGVYRVAGILRDVQELRQSFDTDYLKAMMIAFETDIHAVAGLLKRYFRELPDPLFTDELYVSFVQALGLSDPEARDQCLISLLHSLPPVNFKTAVFLFQHLRRVAANSTTNKMTLTNLATIFGPNLLRPGGAGLEINIAAMDVVTPVSVVLYYLNCPVEYFEEGPSNRTSPDSTSSPQGGSGEKPIRRTSSTAAGVGGTATVESVVLRRGSGSQFPPKEQASADRGSGSHFPPKEQKLSDEAGKFTRRSRRASGRGSKTASNSSLRGLPTAVRNNSTGKVTSLTTTSRDSVV